MPPSYESGIPISCISLEYCYILLSRGKTERHTTGVVCSFRMKYLQYVAYSFYHVTLKKSTIKNSGI